MRRSRRFADLARSTAIPLVVSGTTFIALDFARRLFRHSQLFCPERNPAKSWNPADYGLVRHRVEELWLETPNGEVLYAWYCRAENPIASAVLCHGNTGNLTTIADIIPHLLLASFNVLLFDYRGFGRSGGRASLSGVVSDALTAARHHDKIRPKHLPALLYGYSLGGAIAAQVIGRHHFDALILQSTFTNLPDIARATFPRIPLHLIAGNVFDTLSAIRRLDVPLLVIHGSEDESVPSWMANAIYDACPSPKRLHIVEGGLHKDLYLRDAPALVRVMNQFASEIPQYSMAAPAERPPHEDRWIDSILRFVRRHLRRGPAPETL